MPRDTREMFQAYTCASLPSAPALSALKRETTQRGVWQGVLSAYVEDGPRIAHLEIGRRLARAALHERADLTWRLNALRSEVDIAPNDEGVRDLFAAQFDKALLDFLFPEGK